MPELLILAGVLVAVGALLFGYGRGKREVQEAVRVYCQRSSEVALEAEREAFGYGSVEMHWTEGRISAYQDVLAHLDSASGRR
jgi:hypothetical protein